MRGLISFLLLATTAASPLAAQTWDRGDRGDVRQERRDARQDRAEIRQGRAEVRDDVRRGDFAEARRDRAEVQRDRADFQRDRRDWRDDRRDGRGDVRGDGRGDWRDDRGRGGQDWRYSGRNDGGRNDNRWDGGWRNDRRYDWQGYRSQNRAIFRQPAYYGPRGYSYRRWAPGYRLDSSFYGQRHWIADPYAYRLPPAGGYYRWVRYYDDVALIDIRNGLIADILYSFFWR